MANPDIQQKLYEEIAEMNATLEGKTITYDALQKLPYMDEVISEVLRKWPPAAFTDRLCTKDYIYDNGNGFKCTLEKGAVIVIPVYAIHHDEQYFKDPEKFDPERFNEQHKNNIVPGSYIPFGLGNCSYKYQVYLIHFITLL